MQTAVPESYEISNRFRQSLEARIHRLERDAAWDEATLTALTHEDHFRRHQRLIAVQRAEAQRLRTFLDRARVRLPRPLIAL
jgi:uncharacterized coiled-coil protein SlyX